MSSPMNRFSVKHFSLIRSAVAEEMRPKQTDKQSQTANYHYGTLFIREHVQTQSLRSCDIYTYGRKHAPSSANVVSTTPVWPPATLCHLTYMTLLTVTYLRNDLQLFRLIVRTDLLLLLYGAPRRFAERRLTNLSLYCIIVS